jgi:hypothetical protein
MSQHPALYTPTTPLLYILSLSLPREEIMKQDTERYLMELEEEHTWLAYELRARNAVRMRREHEVRKVSKKAAKNDKKRQQEIEMQQGLSYFRGEIVNYK